MKRAIVLVLLLANLGVFAWVRWYVLPNSAGPQPAPPLTGQPLKLMSELSPAERKALASAAPAPATIAAAPALTRAAAAPVLSTSAVAMAAAQLCASYGPFQSADAAATGLSRLKLLGLSASQRAVSGKAKLGYWVYLPPFGSRKEAQAAADLLKKKGVSDIYVVADEANRNALSLGVFNQKDGAIAREKEIRKLGFHALMADRFRDEPRYWLDAKGVEAALPAADAFKDLADDIAPIGKASTSCAG